MNGVFKKTRKYVKEARELAAILGETDDIARVVKLLKRNNDVATRDFFNNVVRGGNVKYIKLILEHGVDPNQDLHINVNPLIIAVQNQSFECAKLLLKYGADPDTVGYQGCTVLMKSFNFDVSEILLKNGADPNLQDRYGYTALKRMTQKGLCDVMKLLISYGADPWLRDNRNRNALGYAAQSNDRELAKILVNWKTYLPKWNRYTTAARYPIEFNKIVFAWLSSSKLPKDLQYLVLPKMAEKWKLI